VNKVIGLFIFSFLVVTPLLDASAVPVSRDGTKCEKNSTARKDATQDGKKINCLFDTCSYPKCEEKDGKIDLTSCKTVTEHTNARDCKPAKGRVINKDKLQGNSSGTIAAPPQIKKPRFPSKIWTKKEGKVVAPTTTAPTTSNSGSGPAKIPSSPTKR